MGCLTTSVDHPSPSTPQIVVDVQDLKRAQGDLLPRSAAPAPAVAAKPAPTAVPGAIAMSAV